jgi:hypothetical protein
VGAQEEVDLVEQVQRNINTAKKKKAEEAESRPSPQAKDAIIDEMMVAPNLCEGRSKPRHDTYNIDTFFSPTKVAATSTTTPSQ